MAFLAFLVGGDDVDERGIDDATFVNQNEALSPNCFQEISPLVFMIDLLVLNKSLTNYAFINFRSSTNPTPSSSSFFWMASVHGSL